MNIGFEASSAVGEIPTGVTRYIRNFIESIARRHGTDGLSIYYKPKYLKKKDRWLRIDSIPERVYLGSLYPFKKDPDIIHGLDAYVPDWRSCRKFVTFHDILPLLYPDETITPKDFRLKKERDYRRTVEIADRIITVSENTKKDLIAYFGIPEEKVASVYPGVDAEFFRRKSPDEIERVRKIYGLKKDYLLFVGTVSGRKNTARLVEAFARSHARKNIELLLAGTVSYMGALTLEAIEKNRLAEKVKVPGYIANEHLPALYSGARGFLFPTVYEGFGFPLLESMLCETPVLAGNTGSAPEIGGRFPVYVDPLDTDAVAAGIDRLIETEDFEGPAARKHAAEFSWEASARKILEEYSKE